MISEEAPISQDSLSHSSECHFPIDAKSAPLSRISKKESRTSESSSERQNTCPQNELPKNVKWGVHLTQPSYVLLCVFGGILLAIGHHLYYKSLNGTPAGSAKRQQWAITFGASFAFLVTHLLRIGTMIAHSQYVWMMIRRRGYTLRNIDNLFSMASDPRSIFSWEFVKHGKVVILLALITWFLGLASVTPPGTLNVVSGLHTETILTPLPSINWTLPGWINEHVIDGPTTAIMNAAMDTAYEMSVLQIPPPYFNSSYTTAFYGPSLQCKPANSTQKPVFDYYTTAMANQSAASTSDAPYSKVIVTPSIVELQDFNATYLPPTPDSEGNTLRSLEPLVFSAFSPQLGCSGWFGGDSLNDCGNYQEVDQYNNWNVDLPDDFGSLGSYPVYSIPPGVIAVGPNITSVNTTYFTTQQLWLQSTSSEIVCILGNASFELELEYENNVQTTGSKISDFTPLFMPKMPSSDVLDKGESLGLIGLDLGAYVAIFTTLSSILSGNITMVASYEVGDSENYYTADYLLLDIYDDSSKALQTGLGACQDMRPSYWFDHIEQYFRPDSEEMDDPRHTDIFDQPSWKCRNQTLAAAIEDLFNNITISMLSTNMS